MLEVAPVGSGPRGLAADSAADAGRAGTTLSSERCSAPVAPEVREPSVPARPAADPPDGRDPPAPASRDTSAARTGREGKRAVSSGSGSDPVPADSSRSGDDSSRSGDDADRWDSPGAPAPERCPGVP
ncbi:hypothetical protein [Nonomuraea cavernae]|uniref:hypothetical protein n=1 Tax=Nonomuraea cavernae TaxID=2045107 RepID=UPI0033C2AAC0